VASGGLLTSRAPAFSPAASTLLLPTPQVCAPHRAAHVPPPPEAATVVTAIE
jgi:hypothetical protein